VPARRFAHACRASTAASAAGTPARTATRVTLVPVAALTLATLVLLTLAVLGAGAARAATTASPTDSTAGGLPTPSTSVEAASSVPSSATPAPTPTAGTSPAGTDSTFVPTTRRLRMVERRVVTRGLSTRVRARLTRDGHPRRGVMVRFYRRTWDHRHWSYVGHARTRRDGRATITWHVHRGAQWRTRVPAHDGHRSVTSNIQRDRARSLGASAVRVAATRRGDPYNWGADGPHSFDCSGLTRWVFRRLGRSLPHNSAAQYGRVRHIARDHKRVGDLIFFHDGGGHVYHVAIYAGHGMMWHAPHSGARVREQRIFSGSYYVGRV